MYDLSVILFAENSHGPGQSKEMFYTFNVLCNLLIKTGLGDMKNVRD